MNTNNNNHHQFSPLTKEETKVLTSIVKETIASHVNLKKSFSTADLWNIQRQYKAIPQRRQFGW